MAVASTTVCLNRRPVSAFFSETVTPCKLKIPRNIFLDIFFITLVSLICVSRNVSEPCKGRATSNNAEITAVTRAAQQALRGGFYKLRIHTDSEFVVNCATKWIRVWERNGWKTEGNQPVVNRVELQEMIYSVRQLNQVEFVSCNTVSVKIMSQNSREIFFGK